MGWNMNFYTVSVSLSVRFPIFFKPDYHNAKRADPIGQLF